MDVLTLRKYKRINKISKIKAKQTREELVSAVTRHFSTIPVKEIEVVTTFLYSVQNKGTRFAPLIVFSNM
ncbi:hypothetical protein BC936DRAFT_148986 [Jimgerdemannia flammicorona]|uniref:Uncharacterized protein n=2 Tax=Jimgerdemannia flammicorona TaxID=994334 RepID=A0A433QSH3_9FUNG|nr:hypothetical protein BC936DRAFT_148986 [Jimgerdemannia flammicorona]RUS32711.1 hypothetical protein BC938DRAFT_474531 [Jimgerdemannia flammicorona]